MAAARLNRRGRCPRHSQVEGLAGIAYDEPAYCKGTSPAEEWTWTARQAGDSLPHPESVAAFHRGEDAPPLRRRNAAPGPLRTAAAGGTSSGQRPSHTEGVAAFHRGEDAPPLRRRKAAPGPLRTAAAGGTSSGQRPSHTEGVAAFHRGEDAPHLRRRNAAPGPLRTAPACIAPKLLPTARPPSPAGKGGPWAAARPEETALFRRRTAPVCIRRSPGNHWPFSRRAW